jgi:hypothetical protein
MTRFTRCFVMPVLFAAFGVGMVVTLGEPVAPAEAQEILIVQEAELVATEVAKAEESKSLKPGEASRMRWSITLPSPRRTACCRI